MTTLHVESDPLKTWPQWPQSNRDGVYARIANTFQAEYVADAMRKSLSTGRFGVHYQPIVSARTGAIAKVEALLRWNEPVSGYESPSTFIPVAEHTGFIHELGAWVLGQCLRQIVLWREAGVDLPTMSINVSAQQFHSPGFASMLQTAVRDYAIDPGTIELEMTESVLADESECFRSMLAGLRAFGFGLALDDFGTGYSSLSYLQRYRFTTLKVDKRFVQPLGTDRRSQTLTSAIVNMGHELDLEVVAEGVETQEQYDFLLASGCDYLQGYLLGKPALPSQICGRVRSVLESKTHIS